MVGSGLQIEPYECKHIFFTKLNSLEMFCFPENKIGKLNETKEDSHVPRWVFWVFKHQLIVKDFI